MDTIKIIIALLLIAGSAFAVQAESSAEVRRTLMDLIPGAVVTGVHRK